MTGENKGIYFTELTLKNVRCFGDEAVLKLSNDKGEWSRWNVILGDNGTGKTTLLQCLAGLEQVSVKSQNNSTLLDWYAKLMFEDKNTNYRRILNNDSINFLTTVEGIIIVNEQEIIPLTFTQYNTLDILSTYSNEKAIEMLFIIGYGANRRISFQILSEKELEPNNSLTLFDDDAKLINTEEWLYQMDYAAAYAENRDTESKNYTKNRRDLIIELLIGILPDIEDIKFIPKEDPSNPRPVMRLKTPYGWVGIHQLSFGYKTMVAWIVDVAARTFKRYPDSPNPLEEPVVILVDEIDLHLHPKWQRQIFDFLETRFPKAQFIVTAHSPLIVQSAPKDANIIVLKKEQVGGEYVVRIDNDIESVRNWRIDQIMSSDIFGLNTSRNPEIEKQLLERRKLMQKENRNKEEEKRLDELNEMSNSLPTADSPSDIEAMELIRKAAKFLKDKQK